MEHEGAAMYDAAVALRDAMIDLGLACDGGKDSLSMAAAAGGEVGLMPVFSNLPRLMRRQGLDRLYCLRSCQCICSVDNCPACSACEWCSQSLQR
jgi:hypothetical protein